MPLLALISILLASCIILFATSCAGKGDQARPAAKTTVSSKDIQSLSRAEILKLLKRVNDKKAPMPKMGAMCYSMSVPPNKVEYVCPKCSEKTLYKGDMAWTVGRSVPETRRLFETLKKSTKLTMTIDESSFCKHCAPNAKTKQINLHITYSDGATHTAEAINARHLRMLRDFLAGKLTYTSSNDGEYPIKERITTLQELLGMQLGSETDKKETD